MEYNFRKIEKDWQQKWKENNSYKVSNPRLNDSVGQASTDSGEFDKPKCYVLDMFPYPSGAGLHVGHPLGYIASDIYARYKRLKGFNVLHPMGYDSFGLPAEQYALETGQHPAVTTENNINTFRKQLDNIGFCFDWSREIRTSDPKYYKWTQWIFLQLFNSYFCNTEKKAMPISKLINKYTTKGAMPKSGSPIPGKHFTAQQWNAYTEKEQQDILMNRRLAFLAFGEVNWCEVLGTVLANDEVVNGVSERGGHPVVKKKMHQWYLRITAYAERLLQGLDTVEFSDAMKEMQKNWIGKSEGAEIQFAISNKQQTITVYTTRPDTIFGVDFMVLAPEHELVNQITTPQQKEEIEKYLEYVKSRSERERLAELKSITGAFTGAYAINPLSGREIPIWISEYVLAGYGTGAIMAVPCGDQRDFNFAKHFNIPITNIIGEFYNGEEANPTKDAILTNSAYLNGMLMEDAFENVVNELEDLKCGKVKVNYKMRDAGFSRQRYWGEPFPIIYKDGIAYAVDKKDLPVELPHVENYKPGPEGEGPLANITEWVNLNLTPIPSPKERDGEDVIENTDSGLGYITTDAVTWNILKPFAKENRKQKTELEDILWQSLRNRKINNCKFRRQHAIDGFIVDFVCIEHKLVIEVDGDYHLDEEQKKYDGSRTAYLKEQGFKEIRFFNEDVIRKLAESLQIIKTHLMQNSPLLGRGIKGEVKRETNTMPGYAGSSWYFLRYMDPHNDKVFADKKITDYWNQVDVYVGGTEHAVGHLLYSRMWTKVLFDLGYISFDEPFRKLVNQGMIQGSSRFVYRVDALQSGTMTHSIAANRNKNIFLSKGIYEKLKYPKSKNNQELREKILSLFGEGKNADSLTGIHTSSLHVDVNIVDGVELNINKFRKWRKSENANATFILEDGKVLSFGEDLGEVNSKYICGVETEKMSKSKYNTVNPDVLIDKYGADTFRMYEMFLGPVEQSKPWDTKGIEGVHRFLKKLWRLFYDEQKGAIWTSSAPSPLERAGGEVTNAELKVLHKTIKKIEEDTERFSYNTAVSAFMVCVNELHDLKCYKKEILEPLLILLNPYAPHITAELWHQLGNESSILDASFPTFNPDYLIESSKEYPISVNGKMRTTINISLAATQDDVLKIVLENEVMKKWIDNKPIKKLIYVKNKMVNVVV